MVSLDESALICDFAETYRIYDYKALPARLAAVYACGLGQNSRIMQKIGGLKVPINTLLLANIADFLRIWVWMNTVDGQKGRNRPQFITESILGTDKEEKYEAFDSTDAFRKWRDSMIGG